MQLNICLTVAIFVVHGVIADNFCQVPIIPIVTVTVTSYYTPPSSTTSSTSSSATSHHTPLSPTTSHTSFSTIRTSSTTTKIHKTSNYSLGPKATPVAVGYPLCGIPGFTNAMGDYKETTHVQKGGNLKDCLADCRNSGGVCQSIAFHKRYTMCLWYDTEVQGIWLGIDTTSEFVHWDLDCDV